MNSTIKKIIAREGLVIIGIVGLSYFFYSPLTNFYVQPKMTIQRDYHAEEIEKKPVPQFTKVCSDAEMENAEKRERFVRGIGLNILFFGYPIYLLVRFILWAIKTVRKK